MNVLAEPKSTNDSIGPLQQPRLISVAAACTYASVSRSEFYENWLPRLRSRRAGKRRLIELADLNRLIDDLPAAG